MVKNINWGIIGCGDVAEVKSGPAFQNVKNSSLVAVMRRNEKKVKDFANRHHVAQWTTDASKLIENNAVNAVYIATPPSSHLQYALEVIKAGKNVYLEKPMVLNSEEAKILSDALKGSYSKVTIAHYRRELPVFIKVKKLLDSGVVGKVSHAEINIQQTDNTSLIAKSDVNWRVNPEISGGGYFHDIAPHQIDLMCYYFGEIVTIKAGELGDDNVSNHVVNGEVLFENGVKFTGEWNFMATEDMDSCIIYGKKGHIKFSFYGDEIILSVDGDMESFHFSNPDHVQQPMIEKTVNYFSGHNSNPCSVEEAAIVTLIMDVFTGLK